MISKIQNIVNIYIYLISANFRADVQRQDAIYANLIFYLLPLFSLRNATFTWYYNLKKKCWVCSAVLLYIYLYITYLNSSTSSIASLSWSNPGGWQLWQPRVVLYSRTLVAPMMAVRRLIHTDQWVWYAAVRMWQSTLQWQEQQEPMLDLVLTITITFPLSAIS